MKLEIKIEAKFPAYGNYVFYYIFIISLFLFCISKSI